MAWIIEKEGGSIRSLATTIANPLEARAASSPLAWKILQELAKEPDYTKNLAKKLKVHEQKVYYHVRNLKRAGLIKVAKEENIRGMIAKFFTTSSPALSLLLREMEESGKLPFLGMDEAGKKFMEPFISGGSLDALIVVGSPDPHGPTKARSKDGVHAIKIGLFLGGFLNKFPLDSVKTDTEITDRDLKKNLIIVGGPGVNRVSAKVNDRMPIRFVEGPKNQYFSIYSAITKKSYQDEAFGLIVKTKNPFNPMKSILFIAGRRSVGTQAAATAFISKFSDIAKGNRKNPRIIAKVCEGLDMDSDGVMDSVEIHE